MSLESWKAEFYPIPATETTEAQAIDHSLQKWLGLLPENLARHNCEITDHFVMEIDGEDQYQQGLQIDADSCSLCHHFCELDTFNSDDDESPCIECPLYKARGGKACDDETDEEWAANRSSPWHEFSPSFDRSSYNPHPMIMWLKKTKEAQCQKSE